MNIQKALEHFEWKFRNVWKASQKDVEAFNTIIDFIDLQNTYNMSHNESLAKLWIHQLMLLNKTEMYSAERAIQVIDEILEKPVYDWCKALHKQIGLMQLNVKLGDEYRDALKEGNVTKLDELSKNLVEENPEEVLQFLKNDVKEENIIKFVEKNITRIIHDFEK